MLQIFWVEIDFHMRLGTITFTYIMIKLSFRMHIKIHSAGYESLNFAISRFRVNFYKILSMEKEYPIEIANFNTSYL